MFTKTRRKQNLRDTNYSRKNLADESVHLSNAMLINEAKIIGLNIAQSDR